MRKVASWCFRHRVATLVAWVVVLAGLNVIHVAVGSAYTDNFKLPHTGSFDAIRLLQRAVPKASGETDQLVIAVDHGKVTDPAVRARAERLFAQVLQVPHVSTIASPYAPRGHSQIAPSGQVAFANVTFDNGANHNKVTASAAQHFDKVITSASGNG